jgi:hypothetical protein
VWQTMDQELRVAAACWAEKQNALVDKIYWFPMSATHM